MARIFLSSVCAGLALLGAGCAQYRPEPLDGMAALQQLDAVRLEDVVLKRTAAGPEVRMDLSDGLSEPEVVAVALALNPEVKARRLEIGESESLLIAAGVWPNPELGVGLADGISSAAGYTAGADLLFELLRPGERSARKGAAAAKVEGHRAEVAAQEFVLAGEVRGAWLDVLAVEAEAAELKRAVELRQKVSGLLRDRRDAGDVTELEASAAEVELRQVERSLREATREVATTRRALNRLMGLSPEYELRLSDVGRPLELRVGEIVPAEQLDERILAGRFELRAREADYRRAEEELRLAVLQQYPRVSLGPTYERELEGDQALGLGASIELPLLDQNKGEIAEKRAQRDRLRQEFVAALHGLRAEAAEAYAELVQAQEELTAQETDLLPLVRRNEGLFEAAFRAGELPVLDWIAAQERTLEVRREYLQTAVRYRRAAIALESALGISAAPSAGVEKTTNEENHE